MPVRIGLVGCGKWGQNHARVLSEIKNCRFVGIADPVEQTKRIADYYGVEYFKDYRKLLPEVDAVSIVTPTHTHYRIAKDCLSKGKAVLVEKPFVSRSKEARDLIALASQNDVVLAVGHLFRFNPAVRWLKHILRKLNVNYITMRYIHSHKPPRRDCGVILNFGTHLFDIINFIIDDKPKKIFCKSVNYLSRKREDCALILLDYQKFKVFLELSWFHPLKKRDAWIIAEEEKIYADFLEQNVKRYKIKIDVNKIVDKGRREEKFRFKEPLKEELKHFCLCADRGKNPINDGESGYETIRLCEAALKSATTGKEVMVKI